MTFILFGTEFNIMKHNNYVKNNFPITLNGSKTKYYIAVIFLQYFVVLLMDSFRMDADYNYDTFPRSRLSCPT